MAKPIMYCTNCSHWGKPKPKEASPCSCSFSSSCLASSISCGASRSRRMSARFADSSKSPAALECRVDIREEPVLRPVCLLLARPSLRVLFVQPRQLPLLEILHDTGSLVRISSVSCPELPGSQRIVLLRNPLRTLPGSPVRSGLPLTVLPS